MTKPANIKAIEAATHISWSQWLDYFNSLDGTTLSHTEIANKAYEKMDEAQASRGWWSQSVAVAYEQYIGKRQPGQRADGTYEVTVSKTVTGAMDEVMQSWSQVVAIKTEFNGISIVGKPEASTTKKWRHWRVLLEDSSQINVSTYQKTIEKTVITVTSMKLGSSEEAEKWRSFWKEFLKGFK